MYIKLLALCLMNIIVLLLLATEIIFQVGDTTLIGLSWTSLSNLLHGHETCLYTDSRLACPCLYSPSLFHSFSDLPTSPLMPHLSALCPLSLPLLSSLVFSSFHTASFPCFDSKEKGYKKGFKKLATRKWDRQKLTGAVSIPHCQGRGKQRPQAG